MTTDVKYSPTSRPANSPWGYPDMIEEIAPGWWRVYTPSHGGYILSMERVLGIPSEFLKASFGGAGKDGYFEEDCDWCIPVLVFQDEFKAWCEKASIDFDYYLVSARTTFDMYIKPKLQKESSRLRIPQNMV